MKVIVMLVCLVACDAKKPAAAPTWKVAGVDLPGSVMPVTVDFPTVFPKKIGDQMIDSELYALETMQPGVRLFYAGGEPPKHRTIIGYVVVFTQNPVPDLSKKWGPPTSSSLTEDGLATDTESNDCWANPASHVRVCVVKLRPKTRWDMTFLPLP